MCPLTLYHLNSFIRFFDQALNDLLDRILELADRIDNAAGHNSEAEAAKAKAKAIIAQMRPGKRRKGWAKDLLECAAGSSMR